jgi:hypothetical protein
MHNRKANSDTDNQKLDRRKHTTNPVKAAEKE